MFGLYSFCCCCVVDLVFVVWWVCVYAVYLGVYLGGLLCLFLCESWVLGWSVVGIGWLVVGLFCLRVVCSPCVFVVCGVFIVIYSAFPTR